MGATSSSPRWCCCWHCWCATSSAHGDTATGGDAPAASPGSRGAQDERHTATSWDMAAIRLADALRIRANSVRVMMFLLGSPRIIARWCGGFSGHAVGQSQTAPAPFTGRCCTSRRRGNSRLASPTWAASIRQPSRMRRGAEEHMPQWNAQKPLAATGKGCIVHPQRPRSPFPEGQNPPSNGGKTCTTPAQAILA